MTGSNGHLKPDTSWALIPVSLNFNVKLQRQEGSTAPLALRSARQDTPDTLPNNASPAVAAQCAAATAGHTMYTGQRAQWPPIHRLQCPTVCNNPPLAIHCPQKNPLHCKSPLPATNPLYATIYCLQLACTNSLACNGPLMQQPTSL